MADVFQILEGHSSRIGFESTPFKKGNMYFTYDEGGLYVDTESNGEQKRVRINGIESAKDPIYTALKADSWEDNKQTIKISSLRAKQDGVVGLTQNTSKEEWLAIKNANIHLCDQKDGQLTFEVFGDVPNTDIQIVIILTSSILDKVQTWLKY